MKKKTPKLYVLRIFDYLQVWRLNCQNSSLKKVHKPGNNFFFDRFQEIEKKILQENDSIQSTAK